MLGGNGELEGRDLLDGEETVHNLHDYLKEARADDVFLEAALVKSLEDLEEELKSTGLQEADAELLLGLNLLLVLLEGWLIFLGKGEILKSHHIV